MPGTESKNGISAAAEAEKDVEVVSNVLQKFSLSSLPADKQVVQLCVALDEICMSNVRLNDELTAMKEQVTKSGQRATTMQSLVEALKNQVDLARTEGDLKLKAETQKRIESSKHFQQTMEELSALMETSTSSNAKLRKENEEMAKNMTELMGEFDKREERSRARFTESGLQAQLYEAQLAKAKVERAEMNAEFTRERLEMHKRLLDSQKENEELLQQTTAFKVQLEEYQKQYSELEEGMHGSAGNFDKFRTEMDKLGRKLRGVERDTAEWRTKFESSNEQVRRMNEREAERERAAEKTRKKLEAMEKLNRALQEERTKLMGQLKEKEENKMAEE